MHPTEGRRQESNAHMTTGTIKSLRDRGFGFITPDGGNADLFFHHSAVTDGGFEMMQEGQRVSFDKELDPRDSSRERAVRVQLSESERD
jgi:CspA family cold shock protein